MSAIHLPSSFGANVLTMADAMIHKTANGAMTDYRVDDDFAQSLQQLTGPSFAPETKTITIHSIFKNWV
jgi:hypothetical protein